LRRLAVVVYSVNNEDWTKLTVKHLRETIDRDLTGIMVVDNGSTPPYDFPPHLSYSPEVLLRYDSNIGGNAVFHRWIEDDWFGASGHVADLPEFIAFFHCDLMIHEKGWDKRVVEAFDADPDLNLIGFAGSNEIDELGGRGAGTMLNYRGAHFEGIGTASPAEAHGRKMTGLEPAAVLDHMSMIFRRTELEQLTPQEGNFAPFHFYDRILSCEVLERDGHIAVLGVDCDHFSGGTAGGAGEADALMRAWLDEHHIAYQEDRPDIAMYLASEFLFKQKYMHNGFAPLRVQPDYSIQRPKESMYHKVYVV
jgi:hypothetical protein